MTKPPPDATVILLRHGTSPVDAGRDRERPLAAGVADALRRGAAALAHYGPVVALVSSARRTGETADAVLESIRTERRDDLDELYNADAAHVLSELEKAIADGAGCVMVIGHNPGISAASHDLSGGRSVDVLRPGDAVVCERRDGLWRFVERIPVQVA